MSESSPKGCLPYGWQVRLSKSYPDRVYYFNIFTGSSTWECPELDPRQEDRESCPTNIEAQEPKSILCKPKLHTKSKESEVSVHLSKSSTNNKMHLPPTAVVNPVVPNIRTKSKTVTIQELSKNQPFMESLPALVEHKRKNMNSVHSTSGEILPRKRRIKNKKKISPLNRSDGKLIQKCEEVPPKILKQPNKTTSSKSSLDTVLPTAARELPQEVSSDEATDADDIEMQDVSMEILEDLKSKKETVVDTFASYYIVIDTNVLISELHLINELKDTPVDGCGPPHIFIPWVVIEELDRLKSNRNAKNNTMRSACEAVRYLNSVLSKHPRFHGQSPSEQEDWAKTYSKCNDDRILECCMALGDKMTPEKVILLTNDKNLVNKALICSIKVHDWTSMMECIKPDVNFTVSKQKDKWKNEAENNKPASSPEVSKSNLAQKQLLANQHAKYKREIHSVMSNARQLLKNVISQFLEKEMNQAYGPAWNLFPIEKKLLDGMLAGIIKYWRMVFSDFFNDKDKSKFEYLSKLASRPEGFLADKEESMVILNTIEYVFKIIKKRCPQLRVPVEKIIEFRSACVDTFYSCCQIENTIEEVENETTVAVFQRNWSAINQLCGMFLDFCQIPHDVPYDKPNELPSEIEFRQLFCNLYPGVQHLKTSMFKMLESVRKSQPLNNVSKRLYNALLTFIPQLEIPHEPLCYPHFSPKALQKYCFDPQNREMVEVGYNQIEMFFSKLDEVLRALMSKKYKNISSPETMLCD